MPNIWDESIPGIPGMSSTNPGIQDLIKMITMAKGANGMAPNAPTGPTAPGADARPGGPPPSIVQMPSMIKSGGGGTAMPAQNPAMSPAQAGGPAARPQPRGYEGGYEFRSPQARTGAVVDNAIKGLMQGVQNFKQQRFEQEAAQANVIAMASIAKQKQQAGQALTAQDMQAIEASAKLEKKSAKLMEKALTDPMSGAYVGVQRAYQSYQANEMYKAQLEKQQAEANAANMLAKQREAMAKFYEQYKGQIEQGKIDQRKVAEQNKLIAAGALKGQHVEFDENGQAKTRPFTQAEIDEDPVKKLQQKKELALITASAERTKQGAYRNLLREKELEFKNKKLTVDSELKRAQINGKLGQLSNHDKGRMSQVYMAQGYIKEMQSIVDKHPDWFGTGGWGENKMKQAFGQQEPDALAFIADAKLLSLPMVGIHGSRSANLAKDIQDFNETFYQNADAARARLQEELDGVNKAEQDILKTYQIMTPSPSTTPTAENKSKVTIKRDANGRIIGVE